jgi:succinoglycan biosynthesis transport protein ExoP
MANQIDIRRETTVSEPETNLNDMIEKILGIVTRGRWYILVAGRCIPIAAVIVAMRLPSTYVSQATLMVVQQQVSQRYVESDNPMATPALVQLLELDVLSRSRLAGIINDLGLYSDAKQRVPDLLVDAMRKDIEIQRLETTPGRSDFNAFTVSFTSKNPLLAQEVTGRLTSLFIERNSQARGERAAATTKFLDEQLEAAKERLTTQQQRLQAFKNANLGELPEQQQANVAALGEVREQLATVAANLSHAQDAQAVIETSLNDRLLRLRSEMTALLLRYTPRHPEVVKKNGEVEKIQAVLSRLKTSSPAAGKTQSAEGVDDAELAAMLRQADTNAATLERLLEQQRRLKASSDQYQRRLDLTPVREQQLAEILRDYDLFRQDYANLQKAKLQSQLTTSLEENQQGQQFKLIDAPSLPLVPAGPKRMKISLGGMAGGLVVGLALAFLFDLRNSSFHSERALGQKFALPLVLGVPLVLTAGERRARSWKFAFELVAGCIMIIGAFAAEFYVFRNG